MQIHNEDKKSLTRSVVKDVSDYESIVATSKRFPFPFKSRAFVSCSMWDGPDPEDGSYFYFYEPCKDSLSEFDTSSSSSFRAENTGFMKMTPLPDPRRCQFTMVQRIDAKGYVPVWAANRKIKDMLSTPGELHRSFERDDEIDKEYLTKIINLIAPLL